jgi:hypothetical protein
MRRSLVAMLLVVSAVPVLCGPAWARHQSSHHHYRLARRHLPMRAENFAPGVYDYAPAFATGESNGWRRNDWGQSNWSQNSFNQSAPLDGMAAAQASLNGVPVSLVERVIKRESGGNPRAQNRGNYGLMQIRLGTARAMGFSGSAAELLDPQTNMTYAVRYLAGAYRAAIIIRPRRKGSRRMRRRRLASAIITRRPVSRMPERTAARRRFIACGTVGIARCRMGRATRNPSCSLRDR